MVNVTDRTTDTANADARQTIDRWLDRPLLGWLTWERAIYLGFIAIAILTRFWDLGTRVMSHDESLHTYFSYNLATGKGFSHTPLMHGPFLFHATALSYFLFGADDFTSRIPAAVFGVVLVMLPYLFRRELGRTGALVTSFILLISPSILYHARYIRQEEFILVWTVLTILCVWRYLQTARFGWLVGLAAVLAFHATDKSTSFLSVAWLMVFLAPLALAQLYRFRRRWSDAGMGVAFAAFLGVALLVVSVGMEVLARALSDRMLFGADLTQFGSLAALDPQLLIFAAITVVAAIIVVGILTALLKLLFGAWMDRAQSHAPAFNVSVVMVTTTLFMSSPAILLALNPFWRLTSGGALIDVKLLGEMNNLSSNSVVITTMLALSLAAGAVSVAIGLAWNWRRWLLVVSVFGAITVTLFSTVFTNVGGLGTGFVGQLGYWMAQQEVKRGSQPSYYYLLLVPLYEYLVLSGALCAFALIGYRAVRSWLAPSSKVPVSAQDAAQDAAQVAAQVAAPAAEVGGEPIDLTNSSTPGVDADAGAAALTTTAEEPLDAGLEVLPEPPVDAAPADALSPQLHPGLQPAAESASGVLSTPELEKLWPVFLSWWAISAWVIFSLAGEKMPWLTVHIALPMAFLTGWFIEQVVRRPLPGPARRGWRLAATAGLAIAIVALIVRVLSLVGGLNLPPGDAARLLVWAVSFGIGLLSVVALSYALHRVSHGWAARATLLAAFGLLAVLTIRTAIMVTYINYDYAKEFLFYAHGAPGTKLALDQLTDLSKRVNDGNGIKVGYDSDTSWPMSWYMRLFPGARFIGSDLPADYLDLEAIMISDQNPKRAEVAPKLEENYTQFQHTLVWWPMQDYWDLTWDRISYSLFNPEARAALWDIIFNRDYARYAKLFNKNSLTPETWSPSHRFSLYIRNDIASQVWDYRVGAVAGGAAETAPLVAPGSARIQSPVGIASAGGGERFVIDHKANRVFRLSESGALLGNWGGFGGGEGKFNDPWGIAIDDDNAVYVADTFNHRVQKFDREGNFLFAWGQPGVSHAPGSGRSTIFFGPRAIVLDSQGRLFVSDTGNKRVQIFDREGNYIDQLGKEGSGPGEFNEPVGLAIDSGGNVYVADTWNKRIQVFGPDFSFIRSWPVTAWEEMDPTELQSVDHKPFLAIRGSTLYVSSPRTHQVLAYTFTGQPVDDPDVSLPDTSLPTGLAVQGDTLLVTDAASGQVFNFTPPSGMQ